MNPTPMPLVLTSPARRLAGRLAHRPFTTCLPLRMLHVSSDRTRTTARVHANLRGPRDTKLPLVSLKCLDPGSGRKIPAIWHGAGANLSVFIPET